jgi:hypothetical protein
MKSRNDESKGMREGEGMTAHPLGYLPYLRAEARIIRLVQPMEQLLGTTSPLCLHFAIRLRDRVPD